MSSDESKTPQQERRVLIELERSVDCAEAQWHTRHDEAKYDNYENKFKEALSALCAERDYVYVRNPGPKSRGMHCKQSHYQNKLWTTMKKDDKTQKWSPDVTFCYPRVGAFEITVVKGKQRIPVFSKLTIRKWPNPTWLAAKVDMAVKSRLMGGWELAPQQVAKKRKYRTSRITDEQLRERVIGKFSALCAAFKAFDKNGDGCVSKSEFAQGLRAVGIDLPPEQVKQLWSMADEDNTGFLLYQEFARKFSTYKATGSLHRNQSFKHDGKQGLIKGLHGVGATTRTMKQTAMRQKTEITFGVDEEFVARGESLEELNKTSLSIAQMSRDPKIMKKPLAQCNPDEIRARMYKKHGNLVTAWRHFDQDGSNSVEYDEFMKHLPKVLGESIPKKKVDELWYAFDPDMSGAIDGDEFCSKKCIAHLSTLQGVNVLKGQSFDPTMAADYEEVKPDDLIVQQAAYGPDGRAVQVKRSKDIPGSVHREKSDAEKFADKKMAQSASAVSTAAESGGEVATSS